MAAALSAAACVAQAQSVDVVQPNSHYFLGWTFTEITTSPPYATINIAPGSSNTDTVLAGRVMTVTNQTPSVNPGDVFTLPPPGAPDLHGAPANLPANIDLNVSPTDAYYAINRGQGSLMFSQPLPSGSAFFFRDVDLDEAVDIRFVDCGGNLVDAGNFTFLQISVPYSSPPMTPPDYSIQGAAPGRYWHIAAITSGNDNASINGILINSNQVCGVQLSGTRPTDGGSVTYFFGAPSASFLHANKSVASVNGSTSQTRVSEPSDTVDYAIRISNPESVALTVPAGLMEEALPAGVTFVSSADFNCGALPCTNSADVVVPAGGSVTLHVTVKVDASLSRSATPVLTNTVAIKGLNCAAAGNQCRASTQTSPLSAEQGTSVPTLNEISLALLGLLLAGGAAAGLRRKH